MPGWGGCLEAERASAGLDETTLVIFTFFFLILLPNKPGKKMHQEFYSPSSMGCLKQSWDFFLIGNFIQHSLFWRVQTTGADDDRTLRSSWCQDLGHLIHGIIWDPSSGTSTLLASHGMGCLEGGVSCVVTVPRKWGQTLMILKP